MSQQNIFHLLLEGSNGVLQLLIVNVFLASFPRSTKIDFAPGDISDEVHSSEEENTEHMYQKSNRIIASCGKQEERTGY